MCKKDMYTCTEFSWKSPLMTYFYIVTFQFIQYATDISFEKWKIDTCRQKWFIFILYTQKSIPV